MPANSQPWLVQGSLALATLAIAVASLCFGQYPLSLSAVGHTLVHLPPGEGVIGQIVWSVRLPRVVMALLAGGALGLCGATLQGVFQNPLVDPHIIGVTAGSAFGGTLAILLGVGSLLMMASTFFFGLVALGLIYALAALQGRDSTLGLILSGIILSGFFAALVSLMQYLADSEETLPNIVFWLLGSFATASWHKVLLMSLPLAVAAGALWKLRWRINLLALEERDARSLGVPVAALRRGVLVCCAVLVAAQVAVSGSIAWMGLVVPHLARLLVGADHRRLLPTAFWLGAALMLVVDDLARTLTQAEIPIGIITALLGAAVYRVAGAIPTPEYDPMNSSLSLQALRYGHRQPLFAPLTLACRPGEIWAVLGANGRGKSTLLDTLTGVLPPLGGEMQCEGGVALVPQSFRPAFRWRVSDVVLMGRARHVDLFAQPDEEDARRVEQALAQLGIAALAEDDFGALSGGQQQLVLIARALVSASQNILLDEPCSALDLGNQQVVLQLIGDLAHRQARTVLFTTHDPNHALQVASHTLLLLPEGRWLAGETADVLSETHLRQAYGLPVRLIRHAASAFPLLAPGFTLRR